MATRRIRTGVVSLAERAHQRLFRAPMSAEMRRFFGNLSWSFLGAGAASFVMLVLNVVAGRLIGPEGYGRYNLILTGSQLLMLPLIFGLDLAAVRSVAQSRDRQEQARHVSAALYFIIANSLLGVAVFFLLYRYVSVRFSIGTDLLLLMISLTVAMSLRNVSDGLIRALGLYKYQFFGRLVETLVSLAVFLLLFFGLRQISVASYVLALAGGALAVTVFFLVRLAPYLSRFDRSALSSQLSYGKIILVNSVLATVFNSLDFIIIAQYLDLYQVGIYGAYYTSSTNLVGQLVQMFINVFYPSVSKLEDKRAIFYKINHLSWILFLPCAAVMSGVVFAVVRLFGAKYGVHWDYVFGFGILAALQIVYTVYTSLITAISKTLFKSYLYCVNVISLIHVGLYGLMIHFKVTSVEAIIVLMIVNCSAMITIMRRLIARYYAQTG